MIMTSRHTLALTVLTATLFTGVSTASLHAASPSPLGHERARGYLGVEFRDATDDQLGPARTPGVHGVEVVMVDHDGPAGKAGLQPHDILLQMDGQNIEGSDSLRHRIHDSAPGRAVRFAVLRMGRVLNVSATLADRDEVQRAATAQGLALPAPPPPADAPDGLAVESFTTQSAPAPRSPLHGQSFIGSVLHIAPYTGLSMDAMEPQLAAYFGAPPHTGLLVNSVDANSPATTAGIHAGDVILRVDGNPVASNSDWTRRLRAANNGRAITVIVLRDHHEQTLTLQPDVKRHSLLEWPRLF